MARHKKQDASRRLFKLEIRSSKCGQTSSSFKERRFETADPIWPAIENRRSLMCWGDSARMSCSEALEFRNFLFQFFLQMPIHGRVPTAGSI
jgi:hypothetical protein